MHSDWTGCSDILSVNKTKAANSCVFMEFPLPHNLGKLLFGFEIKLNCQVLALIFGYSQAVHSTGSTAGDGESKDSCTLPLCSSVPELTHTKERILGCK